MFSMATMKCSQMLRATTSFAAIGIMCAWAPAAIINVPGDHPTIQAAINAAAISGDTIVVAPGTYVENLTLSKSIVLQGAKAGIGGCGRVVGAPNPAVESVITSGAGVLLTLSGGSAGSVIDGFAFSGGARGIESAGGPLNGLVIRNNHFSGFTSAATFLNDSGVDITIHANEMNAASKVGAGGIAHFDTDNFDGLHFTSNCVINGSTGTGMFVDGNHNVGESASRDPLIDGNLIDGNLTGMNLGSRAFGEFGVPATGSYGGTISNNTFSNNAFDGLQGGMQHCLITGNTFQGNGRSGIALTSFGSAVVDRGAQNCTITDNTFTGNGFVNNGEGILCSSTQPVGTISTNHFSDNSISGNFRGARYLGGEIVDMENNFWGNNTGPTDSSGSNPTSGCTTGPAYVADLVNAGGTGDSVVENSVAGSGIDYCPFQTIPTLSLVPDSSCYDVNDTVVVTVDVGGLSVPTVGGQFFINFDQTKLQFLSAVPGDPGTGVGPPTIPTNPFEVEVYECNGQTILGVCTPIPGRLDYAVGVPGGGPGSGSVANNTMAVLRFKALAEVCSAANLVRFRDNVSGPLIPPTRLSDEFGVAIYPNLFDLPAITIDATAPVITCPPNVNLQCPTAPTPANAGTATAIDSCDPTPTITYSDFSSTLVTPTSLGSWSLFATLPMSNTPGGDGSATLVAGPATPPLGIGSARLFTGTDGEQSAQMRNNAWVGTRIDALTQLEYSTYVTSWNGAQVPYLTIWVDTDGDLTADDRLWFEPAYSGPGFGGPLPSVALNVWQTWNTLIGKWYSDNHAGPGINAITLAAYLALEPNAKIVNAGAIGGIRIASGFASPGDVFDANVDAVRIATSSSAAEYDFEPAAPACGNYTVTRTWKATDDCGNFSTCVQTINVIDTTDPVFVNACPLPTINVNADAGTCEAASTTVNPTVPTATDTCTTPTVTFVRSDGKLNLSDPYEVADSPITITWTATDACGNDVTCTQTVNVAAFNELLLTVQLQPNIAPPGVLTRCIRLELWGCPGPAVIVDVPVTFTVVAGPPNALATAVSVLVPCGNYTCVTARDRLHTLRRTANFADGDFLIAGTQYMANFTGDPFTGPPGGDWLLGGNLNDDQFIDILDFGTFVSQYGGPGYGTGNTTCGTPYPHADISGDGLVTTADYSFIQINFLKFHEANCCGAALRLPGDNGPVTRISVKELIRRGMRDLTVADLNGDGWLDTTDAQVFMSGGGTGGGGGPRR